MPIPRAIVLLPLLLLILPGPGVARVQEPGPPQLQALRVFLDCGRCDFDHLRREVAFVDYVRERSDAQVHVLVTSQETGGGGDEYSFFFIGQREFASREDTLRWTSRQDATDDEVRDGLTRTFALGLVPYVVRTEVAASLELRYRAQSPPRPQAPADDPWHLWVFRVQVGGSMSGERRERSASLEGSFSASRVTDQLKLDFSTEYDYSEDIFELSDRREVSISRNWDIDAFTVWSLGPRWSAGFQARASRSTRVNQDLALEVAPALEYSLFPYTESTRRQITVAYAVGAVRYDYEELTLFDRMRETRGQQRLEIGAGFQQPWGEIDFSLEGSSYLHDFARHRVDLFSRLDVRLFRGLSLDIEANVARIKDQLYLPRREIPDDEILLRRRELGTDYEYDLELGFSYFFGSPFNNIVNPRMARGGGNF